MKINNTCTKINDKSIKFKKQCNIISFSNNEENFYNNEFYNKDNNSRKSMNIENLLINDRDLYTQLQSKKLNNTKCSDNLIYENVSVKDLNNYYKRFSHLYENNDLLNKVKDNLNATNIIIESNAISLEKANSNRNFNSYNNNSLNSKTQISYLNKTTNKSLVNIQPLSPITKTIQSNINSIKKNFIEYDKACESVNKKIEIDLIVKEKVKSFKNTIKNLKEEVLCLENKCNYNKLKNLKDLNKKNSYYNNILNKKNKLYEQRIIALKHYYKNKFVNTKNNYNLKENKLKNKISELKKYNNLLISKINNYNFNREFLITSNIFFSILTNNDKNNCRKEIFNHNSLIFDKINNVFIKGANKSLNKKENYCTLNLHKKTKYIRNFSKEIKLNKNCSDIIYNKNSNLELNSINKLRHNLILCDTYITNIEPKSIKVCNNNYNKHYCQDNIKNCNSSNNSVKSNKEKKLLYINSSTNIGFKTSKYKFLNGFFFNYLNN